MYINMCIVLYLFACLKHQDIYHEQGISIYIIFLTFTYPIFAIIDYQLSWICPYICHQCQLRTDAPARIRIPCSLYLPCVEHAGFDIYIRIYPPCYHILGIEYLCIFVLTGFKTAGLFVKIILSVCMDNSLIILIEVQTYAFWFTSVVFCYLLMQNSNVTLRYRKNNSFNILIYF